MQLSGYKDSIYLIGRLNPFFRARVAKRRRLDVLIPHLASLSADGWSDELMPGPPANRPGEV